jgi:hypothetical protein
MKWEENRSMMAVSTIREAIAARPYRPFTIRVADRRSYTIPHPEFVSIGPQNRSLLVWHEDEGASILGMLMITGIDLPAPGAGEG